MSSGGEVQSWNCEGQIAGAQKMVRQILKFIVIIGLFVLAESISTSAQTAYEIGNKYVLLDLFQMHETDSVRHQLAIGFTVGVPIEKSAFSFEWQRPLISGVRHKNRIDKDRLTSTALVMGYMIAIPAWTMAALGYEDDQITEVAMYVAAPFGPHIAYRPTRQVTFFAGIVSDVILFTEDDGVLSQFRIGTRLDVKLGLTLSLGVAKTKFWGFESPNADYPGGLFWNVSYASPIGSMLFD